MPESLARYVRADQARDLLGLTNRTLQRRLLSGEVPVYRDPRDRRRRMIAVADLDKLITPVPFDRRRTADIAS